MHEPARKDAQGGAGQNAESCGGGQGIHADGSAVLITLCAECVIDHNGGTCRNHGECDHDDIHDLICHSDCGNCIIRVMAEHKNVHCTHQIAKNLFNQDGNRQGNQGKFSDRFVHVCLSVCFFSAGSFYLYLYIPAGLFSAHVLRRDRS